MYQGTSSIMGTDTLVILMFVSDLSGILIKILKHTKILRWWKNEINGMNEKI